MFEFNEAKYLELVQQTLNQSNVTKPKDQIDQAAAIEAAAEHEPGITTPIMLNKSSSLSKENELFVNNDNKTKQRDDNLAYTMDSTSEDDESENANFIKKKHKKEKPKDGKYPDEARNKENSNEISTNTKLLGVCNVIIYLLILIVIMKSI